MESWRLWSEGSESLKTEFRRVIAERRTFQFGLQQEEIRELKIVSESFE